MKTSVVLIVASLISTLLNSSVSFASIATGGEIDTLKAGIGMTKCVFNSGNEDCFENDAASPIRDYPILLNDCVVTSFNLETCTGIQLVTLNYEGHQFVGTITLKRHKKGDPSSFINYEMDLSFAPTELAQSAANMRMDLGVSPLLLQTFSIAAPVLITDKKDENNYTAYSPAFVMIKN